MSEFLVPHSICRFGVARRDVTPPVGIYHRMWGAASHDKSEGVHRPLTATAMVFGPNNNENQRQIILAVDHCLLFYREMEQFLERVCESATIAREELVVAFSHTHAAGLMEERRADLPGGDLIGPYLKEMASQCAAAIEETLASLDEVTLLSAVAHCDMAGHRDFWDETTQQFVCGFNPSEPADDTVQVARAVDRDGNCLATIVNYACHPTTLAWDNRLISPDYVGAMREVVEQNTGSPCIFLQGASGDLGPREGFVGDCSVADRNGRQLGYAALSALESTSMPRTKMQYAGPVISGATIGSWKNQPLDQDDLQAKSIWKLLRFTVDLPYREGAPTLQQTEADLKHWCSEERTAREAGDDAKVADARAMVERRTRQLTRITGLPAGDTFPFPVTVWRMGDAVWLAVEGEPYNLLQRALRERFPEVPIVVIELANGSRVSYLPSAEIYNKGIYQETIAILEKGSLEKLIDVIAQRIDELLK